MAQLPHLSILSWDRHGRATICIEGDRSYLNKIAQSGLLPTNYWWENSNDKGTNLQFREYSGKFNLEYLTKQITQFLGLSETPCTKDSSNISNLRLQALSYILGDEWAGWSIERIDKWDENNMRIFLKRDMTNEIKIITRPIVQPKPQIESKSESNGCQTYLQHKATQLIPLIERADKLTSTNNPNNNGMLRNLVCKGLATLFPPEKPQGAQEREIKVGDRFLINRWCTTVYEVENVYKNGSISAVHRNNGSLTYIYKNKHDVGMVWLKDNEIVSSPESKREPIRIELDPIPRVNGKQIMEI